SKPFSEAVSSGEGIASYTIALSENVGDCSSDVDKVNITVDGVTCDINASNSKCGSSTVVIRDGAKGAPTRVMVYYEGFAESQSADYQKAGTQNVERRGEGAVEVHPISGCEDLSLSSNNSDTISVTASSSGISIYLETV